MVSEQSQRGSGLRHFLHVAPLPDMVDRIEQPEPDRVEEGGNSSERGGVFVDLQWACEDENE